jgi:cytosine/adenosine deaminase-related metal-dependent hydrolase
VGVPSLLVQNARVVTMDGERRVLAPGYVAVQDDVIVDVGPQATCRYDRALYDWLVNVVLPGLHAYRREDVEVATFCSREALLGARDLARRFGTMLTLHLTESSFDRHQCGLPSIEYLGSIGFLGPNVLAGHCVQCDANDLRTLKAFDVKVANNAVSNLFLGSGIAPVAEMQAAGIAVGLGTDDGNCNNSVNLIADMKVAALAQKGRYQRADAISADKVLEMATIDGARAVGLADVIGSLERGKKADLVLLDLSPANMVPCHDVAFALVYQAYGTEVDTVVVDGRTLLEGRRLVGMAPDEERELLAKAQAASERIAADARLTGPRRQSRRSRAGC